MPKDTPLDQIFYWVLIDKTNKILDKFSFVSMSKDESSGMNFREFSNANLQFDSTKAKLIFKKDNSEIDFTVMDKTNVPYELEFQVNDYLVRQDIIRTTH